MKLKKLINVLCLFDYKATTGFATVSHNIVEQLEKEFGNRLFLNIMAVNYFGETIEENNGHKRIFPARLVDGLGDAFGRNEFLKKLADNDVNCVFIINDPGVISPIIPIMRDIRDKKRKEGKPVFKSIFYFPSDAPFLSDVYKDFDFFDLIVPYTEFARKQMLTHFPTLRSKSRVILHGVNHKDFVQMDKANRDEFRKAYFGEENFNRYIIGNINRNQPRKDIPCTIFGFKEYIDNYDPNALLYLHMHPKDELGWDLRSICSQLGLQENKHYMFPPQEWIDKHPEPQMLCCIYNALDLYLTTTTGEGFGLTILEAMQCGVPVIAPLHSAIDELSGVNEGAQTLWPLENLTYDATHFDHIIRYKCDYYEVAHVIGMVRQHPELTNKKIENAKKLAEKLTWKSICERWITEFKQLFG